MSHLTTRGVVDMLQLHWDHIAGKHFPENLGFHNGPQLVFIISSPQRNKPVIS